MKYLKNFESFDLHDQSGRDLATFKEVALQVALKIGYPQAQFIAHGTYGVFIKLDDENGLKITTQKSEIIFASQLKKESRYIVTCFDYFEVIPSPLAKPLYGIVTELCQPLQGIEEDYYDFVYDIVFVDCNRDYGYDTLEELFTESFSLPMPPYVYELYVTLTGIVKETAHMPLSGLDLDNMENIGRSGEGYKMLDFGHPIANTPVQIRKISLE